jgi:hypothetical protein
MALKCRQSLLIVLGDSMPPRTERLAAPPLPTECGPTHQIWEYGAGERITFEMFETISGSV